MADNQAWILSMATPQNIHNPCTEQDSEGIEEEMARLFQEHIKLSAEISELECQLDMKRSILSRYRLRI